MALTAEQRIAAVQTQAPDVETGERIAIASHTGALAAGAALAAKGGWVGLTAYGAGMAGAYAGDWAADKLGLAEVAADGLAAFGLRTIGQGGPHPGVVGCQVAHNHGFAGFLATVAVGALAAVAVGALVVATGGAAAVALIGAAAAGGFAGGLVGGALGGALAQMGARTGPITTGSPDVLIAGKPVARMTDTAACSKESAPFPLIEGSETIFVNNLPMARVGHRLACGAVLDEGADSVFMDHTTVACAEPAPAIPVWGRVLVDWLGILPLGKFAAGLGRRANRTASARAAGTPRHCQTHCGDPVNVATGEFVEWRTDIDIPGVLPFQLRRSYRTRADAATRSLFGPHWCDSLTVALVRRGALIDYHDDEGVCWTFDAPYAVLDAHHLKAPQLVLRGTRDAPELHDRETGARYHFDWQGDSARLSRVEDGYGNHYRLHYRRERLVRLEHSDGYTLDFAWRPEGTLGAVWLHEPDGPPVELVRYQHDARGRLIRSQSDASGHLVYAYDEHHGIIAWGDSGRTSVQLRYDDAGWVTRVDTPHGIHAACFEYDRPARITRVWLDGACTTYHYTADGLVTRVIDPLGAETVTAWDAYQRKVSETDPLGRVTRYAYTDEGWLRGITDPCGRTTRFTYDEAGNRLRLETPDGQRWHWTYDAAGNLRTEQTPDGLVTRLERDARGRLVRHIRPDRSESRFHYDALGRPCGVTAPNGGVTRWAQDRLGRVFETTDAEGALTRYAYPPRSDDAAPKARGHTAPSRVILANGDTWTYRYDAEGLPDAVTDAAGHTRQYRWGAYDLLESHSDPLGGITRYRYDAQARLAAVTNALGQTWRYTYDPAGRLVQETDFAGRITRYRYDAAGRLLVKTAPDGHDYRYTWDERDRLTCIDAGDSRIDYAYDEPGRLTRAALYRGDTLESETCLRYDPHGRLLEETQGPHRIAWRYDAFGRVAGRTTPLGTVAYDYDALGLLDALTGPRGEVHVQRDRLGRTLQRSSRPFGPDGQPVLVPGPQFHLTQRFDAAGHLLAQALRGDGLPSAQRRYHWQHGRLIGLDDARFGRTRYRYDARDQVLEARYDPGPGYGPTLGGLSPGPGPQPGVTAETFGYDALGNLCGQHTPQAHADQTYTPAGSVARRGQTEYRYDARGRTTCRTEHRPGFRPHTWHYRWDAFDRLIQVHTPDGQVWRYTYDAFGRRLAKHCLTPGRAGRRRPLVEAQYLWDGPNLAVEWRRYGTTDAAAAPTETREWHHEPGTFVPLALAYQREQARPAWLHVITDPLGTPRELVSDDGEVVWAGQLRTWGRLDRWAVKESDTRLARRLPRGYRTAANDPYIEVELRFQNQWEDPESGLYYNYQRYYDPDTGQYLSPDPIGLQGGLRPHGYVHNPVGWVDPWGLAGCPPSSAAQYARLKEYLRIQELQSHGFYKPGGGRIATDYISPHAFSRHGYDGGRIPNQNRTMFDENIDVAKLRSDTMSNPDRFYSDIRTRATVYEKTYPFDITPNTHIDTGGLGSGPVSNQASRVHKVFVHPDPTKSTQFPLAPRHASKSPWSPQPL
jgi:RHS repeat-associated protein